MDTLLTLIDQMKSLVPPKLTEDDPLLEENWNILVDFINKCNETMEKVWDVSPPVGFVYFQLPGKKRPDEKWQHQASRWKDVSDEFAGLFFRVAGGAALPFDTSGNAAHQGSANLRHTHPMQGDWGPISTGSHFGSPLIGPWGNIAVRSHTNEAGGDEARPPNKTIIVWERIN